MKELLQEAEEMLAALDYCTEAELCDGCPKQAECCDPHAKFTITNGAAEMIRKLADALREKAGN